MKTTKLFAAALIAALGFSACTKDGGKIEPQGSPAEVAINLKVPAGTRADAGTEDGAGNEIEVKSLEFFIFNSSGDPDTKTPYLKKTANLSDATNIPVTAENGKIFLVGVNTNIFADAAAYESAATADAATVKHAAIFAKVASPLELTNTNSQTDPGSGGFIMSSAAVKNVQAAPATNTLTMTIERVISKIEEPVTAASGVTTEIAGNLPMLQQLWSGVTDVTQITNLKWTFDGYVVINGIRNSYVFEHEWDQWTAPYLTPATDPSWFKTLYTGNDITAVYGGDDSAADKFIAQGSEKIVYVYENSPQENGRETGEAVTFKKDQVTAFLIKGTFSNDNSATYPPVTRYWRVNLIEDDVWKIYRNSIYRVTMNQVLTPGYATPEEAENANPIVDPKETSIAIDLLIAPWQIKTQGVDL